MAGRTYDAIQEIPDASNAEAFLEMIIILDGASSRGDSRLSIVVTGRAETLGKAEQKFSFEDLRHLQVRSSMWYSMTRRFATCCIR